MANSSIIRKAKNKIIKEFIKDPDIITAINSSEVKSNEPEKLVYKHDIFMFIKPYASTNPHWKQLTPELVENEIADLESCGEGEKLMRWLVMVGRSDSLAQNPAMTKESLELLESFDDLIDQRGDDGKEI